VLALVLGGGNAVGAYHGGVVAAMEAAAVEPYWLAGSSIAAVMAALVAGNPHGQRTVAMREFWRRGTQLDGPASWVPEGWRKAIHMTAALQARTMGRPALYQPRLSQLIPARTSFDPLVPAAKGRLSRVSTRSRLVRTGITGLTLNPGMYDAAPMRCTIEDLVDFDLLNSGAVRVSVMTVDLESGLEHPFDTVRDRLTADHILASAALIPDFPAVEINGRAYVDGGLAANVPVDLVLQEPPSAPLACFSADPFPRAGPRPRRLGDAAERQTDLIFASQTERTLRAMQQIWDLRDADAPGAVYRLTYASQPDETAMKGFDFSQSSIERRWQQGETDMGTALRLWRDRPPFGRGLQVHDATASQVLADA